MVSNGADAIDMLATLLCNTASCSQINIVCIVCFLKFFKNRRKNYRRLSPPFVLQVLGFVSYE